MPIREAKLRIDWKRAEGRRYSIDSVAPSTTSLSGRAFRRGDPSLFWEVPVRYRSLGFVLSASLCGAFFVGCADGGSSATRSAGAVPVTQQGASATQGLAGRKAPSGVRRTRSVQTCSGTGPGSYLGGGTSNVAAGEDSAAVAGESNMSCDAWSSIVGGADNIISGLAGSSGANNDGYNFIGGGLYNTVSGNDGASAIVAGDDNEISNAESAIVGGSANSVDAFGGLIGAGYDNAISGPSESYGAIVNGYQNKLSGEYGFIGAGISNTVSGEGGYIAAGGYNSVTGLGAVIDGGFNSTAAGTFATIPGGYVNSAAGSYSFAAGARASAVQNGTFVWSDGSDGDTILSSTAAYQFLARASGGFTLWTNAASTVGARLAPGSGTWASASDRNLKTDVARIDDAAVLDKVATLPIERWSYKSERGVRHVGPMAQDFYAAFGVGEDDKHITSIDEDGVALAAIKALHAENARLRAGQHYLRSRLAAATISQAAKIAAMQSQIQRLTTQMAELRGR
jgi:trimeric autotransporter adhesin